MKLLRLSMMTFSPPPKGWDAFSTTVGDVTVHASSIADSSPGAPLQLFVKAEIPILFPKIGRDRFVCLPEDKRELCERALQIVADLISVHGRCQQSLLSANPSWALDVEDPEERARLETTRGVKSISEMVSGMWFQIPRSDEMISGLNDRVLDGVAILAEAFSQTRASGKYREFVRLFEAAFASTFSELERKLYQFLHPVMGYSRQEIQEWVALRDPITHADRKKTDLIAFNIDVRKVIYRMEQAALDVLFNKEVWHNNSKTRRNLWIPPAVKTLKSGIIKQGSSNMSVQFQVFDDFGVFPVRLESTIKKIPKSWWFKAEGKGQLDFSEKFLLRPSLDVSDSQSGDPG